MHPRFSGGSISAWFARHVRGFLCALLFLCGNALEAQESLRASLASEDAARARREAVKDQKFNVEFGTFGLRLMPRMEIEANDNVTASSTDPQADLLLRPSLGISSLWRLTELNSLNFGLGVGFMKYLRDTEPQTFFVTPGSDFELDVVTGDVTINLHSRFSYSQDVSYDPTVSGVGSVPRFVNSSGLHTQWDLNQLVVSAAYDHIFFKAMESDYSYLSHSSDLASISAGLRPSPMVMIGFQVGGGITDYDEDVFHDSIHVAAGPVLQWHVSDYTQLRAAGGYTAYFDTSDTATSSSALSSFYFDFRLRNRLNEWLTQSIYAGQQVQSGVGNSTFKMLYVRHEATWRVVSGIGLTTVLSYENVPASGTSQSPLNRYGLTLRLQRALTEHISGSLQYQLYHKVSELSTDNYTQNRLVLGLGYTF